MSSVDPLGIPIVFTKPREDSPQTVFSVSPQAFEISLFVSGKKWLDMKGT